VAITTTCLEVELPATIASVRLARGAVEEAIREITDSERFVDDVRLCVSEAVTNVVRHAYVGRPAGEVDVVVERDERELVVSVSDTGNGPPLPRDRPQEGGYGLEIIRKLSTRHAICGRPGGGTELHMVFALPVPPTSALR
jgi:serine/threonine-protein kinase RsbW